MENNLILYTDSYKLSHFLYYPRKTTEVYSYMESRGGKYAETPFLGMQSFLGEYLSKPITKENIEEAADFASLHGVPFNKEGWTHILEAYNGWLPLEIKAVPEGLVIPTRNVMATVRNTSRFTPWLTSYIESALLANLWYPCTVGARLLKMKRAIKPYFDDTSDEGNMDFALLDFSVRGCSSRETNERGGSAFLMFFKGSDSIPAIRYTNKYYGSDMSGFSVPATEHSIMTSYGKPFEYSSLIRIVDQTPFGSILSIVGDSWDIFNFVDYFAEPELFDLIVSKKIKLVVRPDSGKIIDVMPEVLKKLASIFGWNMNKKGYRVLGHGVKVLWPDGINEDNVHEPFMVAKLMGFSADSVMAASGGGLMQANIDRDTCKFAFKASNVIVDGLSKGIAKDPITDPGKKSKKGYLSLVDNDRKLMTVSNLDYVDDILQTVYHNGFLVPVKNHSVEDIRARINEQL